MNPTLAPSLTKSWRASSDSSPDTSSLDSSRLKKCLVRSLSRFFPLSKTLMLSDRLFEQPKTNQDLRKRIAKVHDNLKVVCAQMFILEKILLDKEEDVLSTLDLAFVAINTDLRVKATRQMRMSWNKFDLSDFDETSSSPAEIFLGSLGQELERRLSQADSNSENNKRRLYSVKSQLEQQSGPYPQRVFLRVKSVKTKSGKKKKSPNPPPSQEVMYFLYVSGSSHFFCDSEDPDPIVHEELCNCLQGPGCDEPVQDDDVEPTEEMPEKEEEEEEEQPLVVMFGDDDVAFLTESSSSSSSTLVPSEVLPPAEEEVDQKSVESPPAEVVQDDAAELVPPPAEGDRKKPKMKKKNNKKKNAGTKYYDPKKGKKKRLVQKKLKLAKSAAEGGGNGNGVAAKEEHACPQCDYRSIYRPNIHLHLKTVHMGIKDHQCPFCQYKSAHPHHVQRHVKAVHVRVKDQECPHCDYRCVDPGNMPKHVKAKHPEARSTFKFKCGECDFRASLDSHLKKHEIIIHKKRR